jgi:F-type H+-transporting ATPase subunit b
MLLALAVCLAVPHALRAQAQPQPAHPAAAAVPAPDGGTGGAPREDAEAHEGRGIIDVIARLVNFALLAGALGYMLRTPLKDYLADRGNTIRQDLVNADAMKKEAAAQIAEIDRKMRALPGELEALRAQVTGEIASEEARIHAAAAAERDRLLEQARREIEQRAAAAERELANHAADLAVALASDQIRKNITPDDQTRLVDRYVSRLKH